MKIVMAVNGDYTGGAAVWARAFTFGLTQCGVDTSVIKSPRQKLSFHTDPSKEHVIKNKQDGLFMIRNLDPDLVIFQSGHEYQSMSGGGSKYNGDKYPMWDEIMFGLRDIKVRYTFATHDGASVYDRPYQQDKMKRITGDPRFIGSFIGCSYLPDRQWGPLGMQMIKSLLPIEVPELAVVNKRPYSGHRVALFSYAGKLKQWAFIYRAAILADQSKMVTSDGRSSLHFSLTGGAASTPAMAPTTKVLDYLIEEHGAKQINTQAAYDDIHKPIPWEVELKNGTGVSYDGGFGPEDVYQKLQQHDRFINTTIRVGGSEGPIEYTTLEAIWAGLTPIVPHMNALPYSHLGPYAYLAQQKRHAFTPAILQGKEDTVVYAMLEALGDSFYDTSEMREMRRRRVYDDHSPEAVVSKCLHEIRKVL